VETFLQYVSLISRYGGIAKSEVEIQGREYAVSVLHDLGLRWSIFLQHFIDSGLQSTLGIKANFDVTKNSVIVKFAA
jgi:hypothetical protein